MSRTTKAFNVMKSAVSIIRPKFGREWIYLLGVLIFSIVGKKLDVLSVKYRSLVPLKLFKLQSKNITENEALNAIGYFFFTRSVGHMFIELKNLLLYNVTTRGISDFVAETHYLSLLTYHVKPVDASKVSRVLERGGKQIEKIIWSIVSIFIQEVIKIYFLFGNILKKGHGPKEIAIIISTTLIYACYTIFMGILKARNRVQINIRDNAISRRIYESLTNADIVKTYNNEYIEVGRFNHEIKSFWGFRMNNYLIVACSNLLQRGLFTGLYCVVSLMILYDNPMETLTIEMISAHLSFVSSVDGTIWKLGDLVGSLSLYIPDSEELIEFNLSLKALAKQHLEIDISKTLENVDKMTDKYIKNDIKLTLPDNFVNEESEHVNNTGLNVIKSITKKRDVHINNNEILEDDINMNSIQNENAVFKSATPIIEFKNVNFAYSTKLVLKNISLSVSPGEKIAIVGESGCGKSTILKLMTKFYEYQGTIEFNGKNISECSAEEVRNQLGYIFQETNLFDESMYYNVLYGKPSSDSLTIHKACEKAGLSEIINKKGINHRIGEQGKYLSGGEAQRVALARCLLKNSNVMLMDEVTSNLDVENEKKIFDLIMNNNEKTIIMVLHNIWLAKKMNKILFIKNGKIEEIGSHDELMSKKGDYWKMAITAKVI